METGGIIKTIISFSAAVVILLVPTVSSAATDMIDLYNLALKNDPKFLASGHQFTASQETLRQAYANILPTLTAEGSYTNSNQDMISSDNTVFDVGRTRFDAREYSLTLTQPVFNYAYFVEVRQAKSVIKQSDMEIELAGQEMILRVAELYLEAMTSRDNLNYAKAEEEVVKKHLDDAKARHNAGLVPITDLYDARARYASVQADRVEAENLFDDALQTLKEVAGEPITDIKELKEEVPLADPEPADVDLWVKAALEQNLEVSIQRHEVTIAREDVNLKRAGHYPTLDLAGRYNRQETGGTVFGGGSEVETTDIFVTLKIPIYEGGIVSSRMRQTKSLYLKAEEELNELTRSVDRKARAAFSGVKTAISRVESLQKSIESQQLVLETKQNGFESGLFTSLAVLDAGRDLYLYKKDHAKARYDYVLNNLKLRQTVGTLTANDLEQINNWLE